uniref:3-ketoacyl-CoA synthase n=1 Tax=Picea sitchensis TaxID=3332 RepID=D5A9Z6_PICSI|nr:unknown [Picea sitchensis]
MLCTAAQKPLTVVKKKKPEMDTNLDKRAEVFHKLPLDFAETENLNSIKMGYSYLLTSVSWPRLLATVALVFAIQGIYLWMLVIDEIVWFLPLICAMASILIYYFCASKQIYMVEVSCYRPPQEWRVSFHNFIEHAMISQKFTAKSVGFQKRILERAAVSEYAAVPPALRYLPPRLTHAASRQEAEIVMFGCVRDLLEKTGVDVHEVGVLVVNCSVFNPIPSLSSLIVNKFGLRSDIKTYNLGGMGCSANLIALDLASACLRVSNRGTYAIVLSTENITENWYFGNYEPMLVSNILFRIGCGAVLLSNKRSDRHRAKYRLLNVVRTQRAGVSDIAYRAAFQEEDPTGTVGVNLSKDIMDIAAEALKANMRELGPLVLPYYEQILYFTSRFFVFYYENAVKGAAREYVPDFKSAFDHICIHSGGKAVIRAVEKGLGLRPEMAEASKMVLYRFGNTSSSSTWYQFQYLESKGRMRKGQKIWQICLGSGFKCNSAVWVANIDIAPPGDNAWSECIIDYPVQIPEIQPIS